MNISIIYKQKNKRKRKIILITDLSCAMINIINKDWLFLALLSYFSIRIPSILQANKSQEQILLKLIDIVHFREILSLNLRLYFHFGTHFSLPYGELTVSIFCRIFIFSLLIYNCCSFLSLDFSCEKVCLFDGTVKGM